MRQAAWVFIVLIGLFGGCTAPHYIWKQTDMARSEINPPTMEQKLLIASRDSEFKQALVHRITEAFADRDFFIRIVGIEALADENAQAYGAVVILNTAMGWTVDIPVERFLEKYGQMDTIIVLTTADGGDVFPDLENRNVDAMSSASVMDQAGTLADTIIAKIDRLMDYND